MSIVLERGDILGLISDGIYEYEDEDGIQFGQRGVIDVIDEMPGALAKDIVPALLEAVREHGGSAPQEDDITIVLVRRKP